MKPTAPTIESLYALLGAVIHRALLDANETDEYIAEKSSNLTARLARMRNRTQARYFFYGKDFQFYCDQTGLNPIYIRNALSKEAQEEGKNHGRKPIQ